jgi:hypothetical protein
VGLGSQGDAVAAEDSWILMFQIPEFQVELG